VTRRFLLDDNGSFRVRNVVGDGGQDEVEVLIGVCGTRDAHLTLRRPGKELVQVVQYDGQ